MLPSGDIACNEFSFVSVKTKDLLTGSGQVRLTTCGYTNIRVQRDTGFFPDRLLGPTKPPVRWTVVTPPPIDSQATGERPSSSAEINNAWSCTSCSLKKHRAIWLFFLHQARQP